MLTTNAPASLSGETSTASMLQMAQWHARAGDPQQAEHCYRSVLQREPHNVAALQRLALLLQGDPDRVNESLHLLDTALAVDPDNAALHTCRAVALNGLGRRLDAMDSFADAVCLQPDNPNTLYNLGLLLADLCCPAQAELYARLLLAHAPDWPAAQFLLLRALTSLDADPAEIDARYAALIKTDPCNLPLRFARGMELIKRGDYAAGWDAHEWRCAIEPEAHTLPHVRQPRWAGGPLAGRRLLISGEQGYGDILQFARYLPLLTARAAHVILQLAPERAGLVRLFSCIDGLEVVVGTENLPAFDLHCPLASLPYVFDTTLDTIPAPPYLQVKEEDVAAWKARLAHLPRPWIGICWAGSPGHNHNVRRSLPLSAATRYYRERQDREQRIIAASARVGTALSLDGLYAATASDALPSLYTMEPLLRRTAGSLISLQVGPHASDIDEVGSDLRARITAPLEGGEDYYDTACLIQALDEVITVDTSVAHLTGALGQRGMVITPVAPEWRWIERDGKLAWYPNLRPMQQHALAAVPH